MWIKTTTPYTFLSAHIYIIDPILSTKVNYPSLYVTREGTNKYYNRMIHSQSVELIEKACKMLMKLESPRMSNLKIHHT